MVDVAEVEGFWTVNESLMSNLVEGGQTRLLRTSADYNLDLADQNFSERALRNGIR